MKPFETSKQANNEIVFVHVNKCAGTSLKLLASEYSNVHYAWRNGDLVAYNGGRECVYGNIVDIESINDFVEYFAIVRHPLSRCASMFRIANNRRSEGFSSDDFVNLVCGFYKVPSRLSTDNRTFRRVRADIWTHTRPVSWYSIRRYDGYLRFESLQSDWRQLMRERGISDDLPHMNGSEDIKTDYREVFSNSQIQRLAEYYRHDLLELGYEV